jgi:UDP-N-acetylglucosamine:LPS N-acetylglucosamine transferase
MDIVNQMRLITRKIIAKFGFIKIKTLHRSLNPFDDLRAFFTLRRVIKEINPDLVNTHTSKAGVLGRIAAKIY